MENRFFQYFVSLVIIMLIRVNTDFTDADSVEELEDEETQNLGDYEVEKKYKEMHPNWELCHKIPWRELENLTAPVLKELCTQVLFDIFKSYDTADSFSYTKPKNGVLERRILQRAKVKFRDGMKFMPVVKCLYKTSDFYLTRGNDKNVFRLERVGGGKPSIFYFHDGPHPIHYPNI